MDSLCAIVDRCLEQMKPHELWSWGKMSTDIFGNGEVPTRKTFKYQMWIEKRNKIKQRINRELTNRKRPERLICVGQGKGVFLVNENDVAEHCTEKNVRRIVNAFEGSVKETRALANASKLSTEDRKMLHRIGTVIEVQNNTMLGTIAKMKSLPPAAKKHLLKKLGFDPKKI